METLELFGGEGFSSLLAGWEVYVCVCLYELDFVLQNTLIYKQIICIFLLLGLSHPTIGGCAVLFFLKEMADPQIGVLYYACVL